MTIAPNLTLAAHKRRPPRVSLNMWFTSTAKDYPYLNFVKASSQLSVGNNDSGATPLAACVDEDGFLVSTPTNAGNIGNVWIPQNFAGYWVLKWKGNVNFTMNLVNGTLEPCSCVDYAPSENFSLPSKNNIHVIGGEEDVWNRVTFKLDPSVTRIAFQTKTPFSGLVLCQGDPAGLDRTENIEGTEEWRLSQGEIYRPDYINLLKMIRPKSIRLMQRHNVESSRDSLFWTQNTLDSLTWAPGRWDPRLWAGDAVAADQPETDNYVVSAPANYPGGFPAEKTNGAMIQCRLTTAGTAGNNICQSQKPAEAGNLTLDGSLVSGGVVTFSQPRAVGIKSSESETSRSFTVTGHVDGVEDSEVVTGGGKNAIAYTTKLFDDVTGVSVDGATTGNITVGTMLVTLNVGDWGEVVVTAAGQPNTPIDGSYVNSANMQNTFVYIALFDKWMFSKNTAPGGLGSGEPVAAQVALCNAVGCDLWLNLPLLFTDESYSQMIEYVAKNLDPRRKCIIEYYNECWNGLYYGTQFSQAAVQKPPLNLSVTNNYDTWFGYKMSLLAHPTNGPLVPTWTKYRKRKDLVILMGTWIANNTTAIGWRWGGTNWPSPPSVGERPIDYCDGACVAMYSFGAQMTWGGTGGTTGYTGKVASVRQDLWDAADDYDSGDPERMADALEFVHNDYINGSYTGMSEAWTVAEFDTEFSKWNDRCTTYGVTPSNGKAFWCYEGGYAGTEPSVAQCTALGIDTDYNRKVRNLAIAYRNSDQFRKDVITLYETFLKYPNLRGPHWYHFCSNSDEPFDSPWSLFPDNITREPYRSFDALAQLNGGTPYPRS